LATNHPSPVSFRQNQLPRRRWLPDQAKKSPPFGPEEKKSEQGSKHGQGVQTANKKNVKSDNVHQDGDKDNQPEGGKASSPNKQTTGQLEELDQGKVAGSEECLHERGGYPFGLGQSDKLEPKVERESNEDQTEDKAG